MYKIILAQLDWILPLTDWIVPEGGLYLNPHNFSRYSAIEVSGVPIATSASRLFFRVRRPAAVTNDECTRVCLVCTSSLYILESPRENPWVYFVTICIYLPLELY
ncbi:hypothetical protein Zmor_023588 [Zophobas morio]|uniref:Uncharacterized protein n=1 Tax=Zophobas morio TaxID=2755281 RepID=A0AA38HX83_9CUCU|nr:hypothetical protein Zmor_023588 [Zophobas morio]